jgi:polo-like kinase 1
MVKKREREIDRQIEREIEREIERQRERKEMVREKDMEIVMKMMIEREREKAMVSVCRSMTSMPSLPLLLIFIQPQSCVRQLR